MFASISSFLSGVTGNNDGSAAAAAARRRSSVDYPANGREDGDEGGEYGRQRPAQAGQPARSPESAISASVPRVQHSMTRIKSMLRKLNPELLDTLSYPAGAKQIAALQAMLQNYAIPKDILDAYAIHDGQDSFSVPRGGQNGENEGNTGFIYGLWWMSIEEVIEEYTFWRRLDISNPPSPVAAKRKTQKDVKGKGKQPTHTARAPSTDAFLFGSEMDPHTVRATMRSCPEGYVREEYSHPSWLPLLKDGYGNYIGLDLDPPTLPADEAAKISASPAPVLPARGQIIAFGREIDTKTVLWSGWADTNAYDNLGGGGFARFLAGFADDLSASGGLHRNSRYKLNDPYSASSQSTSDRNSEDDDDEEAYRFASGGRQESSQTHRSGTALEWIEANPAYSGLGIVEALVERSRGVWMSLGLVEMPQVDDQAVFERAHPGIDRSHKPPPLEFAQPSEAQRDSTSGARVLSASSQGRSISHPNSAALRGSAVTSSDPLSAATTAMSLQSTTALMASEDADDEVNLSTTSLSDADGHMKPPVSPDPSLILSPPSPKANAQIFQSLPPSSPPPQQTASTSNSVLVTPLLPESARTPSPTLIAGPGLQSPARMSPGQAARFASRQRERTRSGEYGVNKGTLNNNRSRKPPPPAMPLGLPTLEFGNGIWEQLDVDGMTKDSSFEIVVDGHR